MSKVKIAITLDSELLKTLDELVYAHRFRNRSNALEEAVSEMLARIRKTRLAEQCAKLSPVTEPELAEGGMRKDIEEWPEY